MEQQEKIRPSSGAKKKGLAADSDKLVGQRIKEIRKAKKLTQSDIANALGVTFQQIQKYEKGQDRISFSRVYDLSKFMGTDLDNFASLIDLMPSNGLSDNIQKRLIADNDSISQKEIDDVLQIYGSVKNPKDRKKLLNIIKATAENLQE